MNIYFACSITGGREFESVYQAIVQALVEKGHDVPTAHLAESSVMAVEAVIDPSKVYSRDVAWIRGCDVLIAEVSIPSHGVGYEIGFALGIGKPVLALYKHGQKVSKMISGNPDKNLTLRKYSATADAVHSTLEFVSHRE
jgi:nucleoside 2-deoxyribosyltransferase